MILNILATILGIYGTGVILIFAGIIRAELYKDENIEIKTLDYWGDYAFTWPYALSKDVVRLIKWCVTSGYKNPFAGKRKR